MTASIEIEVLVRDSAEADQRLDLVGC